MSAGNGWSEAEKALVRRGYECGWSLKEIAALVPGRSRNSVSGQARRMGLVHPGVPEKPDTAKKEAPAPKPTPQAAPASQGKGIGGAGAPMAPKAGDKPVYTPVEKVKARVTPSIHKTCRWPEDETHLGKIEFCGEACAPGYSYCVDHCLRAYTAERNKKFTRRYFETRRLA